MMGKYRFVVPAMQGEIDSNLFQAQAFITGKKSEQNRFYRLTVCQGWTIIHERHILSNGFYTRSQ